MKKILPFLIIGIVVISSIGVVATFEEKSNSTSTMQPELEILAKGGIGITIYIENHGTEPYEQQGTFEVTIDAPLMILGASSILETPDVIEANEVVKLKTGLILGLGKCSIMITFDMDNDGEADTEASGEGMIFGPFVFTPVIPIPPPSP